jgi:uncharacterized membrane protein YfcA
MAVEQLTWFLVAVAIGTYVQTTSGFAIGLIVMAAATLFDLVSIAETAIVISAIGLFNNLFALRGRTYLVSKHGFVRLSLFVVPSTAVGIWLLDILDSENTALLQQLLGWFILVGGGLMLLRPDPRANPASLRATSVAGIASGLATGLFSAGGPPMVYHLYREPISIAQIRATLFALFIVSALSRTVMVGTLGDLSPMVIELVLWSLPVVWFFTLVGRRWTPPLSDRAYRRAAFGLLALLSLPLILQ